MKTSATPGFTFHGGTLQSVTLDYAASSTYTCNMIDATASITLTGGGGGGGGGGASRYPTNSVGAGGGGGGGAGQVVSGIVQLSLGVVYTITVAATASAGAGGAVIGGDTANPGTAGNSSSFSGSNISTLTALGGSAGLQGHAPTWTAGGGYVQGSGGTGGTLYVAGTTAQNGQGYANTNQAPGGANINTFGSGGFGGNGARGSNSSSPVGYTGGGGAVGAVGHITLVITGYK